MKGFIYKYIFPDGKVYIGQTRRNMETRHKEHISSKTGPANSGFWKAYERFKSCEYEILEEVDCIDEYDLVKSLNEKETYYIYKYKSFDPQYGYNKRSIGSVSTHTESLLYKYWNEKYTLEEKYIEMEFKKITDKIFETKEPLTEKEKEYISVGNFPANFNMNNLKENNLSDFEIFMIEEELQFSMFTIKEQRKTTIWQDVEKNRNVIISEGNDTNAIVSLDKHGNIIDTFHSFKEIAEKFNVLRADNVRNVLWGKQKTAYGLYWKYKRDL